MTRDDPGCRRLCDLDNSPPAGEWMREWTRLEARAKRRTSIAVAAARSTARRRRLRCCVALVRVPVSQDADRGFLIPGALRANVVDMGVARRTVTVQLDEDLVERARDRSGRGQAKDAAEIVEEALAVYLGMKALDEAQAESILSEDEASQLAYDELRALRQERRGAA